MKDYYPQIRIDGEGSNFKLSTILRKEHNGEWYEWAFIRSYNFDPLTYHEHQKISALLSFNAEVYAAHILGVISTDVTDLRGDQVFIKCDNQDSEKVRLRKLMY